jgi:hypothetical protein
MGLIDCPETSLTNNKYTLCNIPEERRPHLLRGGSLTSRIGEQLFTLVKDASGFSEPWVSDLFMANGRTRYRGLVRGPQVEKQ